MFITNKLIYILYLFYWSARVRACVYSMCVCTRCVCVCVHSTCLTGEGRLWSQFSSSTVVPGTKITSVLQGQILLPTDPLHWPVNKFFLKNTNKQRYIWWKMEKGIAYIPLSRYLFLKIKNLFVLHIKSY